MQQRKKCKKCRVQKPMTKYTTTTYGLRQTCNDCIVAKSMATKQERGRKGGRPKKNGHTLTEVNEALNHANGHGGKTQHTEQIKELRQALKALSRRGVQVTLGKNEEGRQTLVYTIEEIL